MLQPRSLLGIRLRYFLIEALSLRVCTEEHTSKEPTINRRLVQHDRVLLVVPTVAGNRNNTVTSCSQLLESEVLHTPRCDQWLLRIIKDMRQGVHSHLVVRCIDTHCLLAHSTLIAVPRGLVVVWEWNNACTDT